MGSKKSKKHFVHDLGARPQHEANKEGYEEGGGENDTTMDLQNFGDDENWLGSLVGGQLDDLDFGLSETMEVLYVGGRNLNNQVNTGFRKIMKKNRTC